MKEELVKEQRTVGWEGGINMNEKKALQLFCKIRR